MAPRLVTEWPWSWLLRSNYFFLFCFRWRHDVHKNLRFIFSSKWPKIVWTINYRYNRSKIKFEIIFNISKDNWLGFWLLSFDLFSIFRLSFGLCVCLIYIYNFLFLQIRITLQISLKTKNRIKTFSRLSIVSGYESTIRIEWFMNFMKINLC